MITQPEIIQTNEQITAVIPITVERSKIESVMGPAIGEIIATLAAQGMTPSGPLFSYHLKRPSDIFDFEVGFPVSSRITPSGRVQPGKLPAVKVVRTNYHGGYEGLGAAWGELFAWIEVNKLNPQSCLWECYQSGPEAGTDSSKWITVLNAPLTA